MLGSSLIGVLFADLVDAAAHDGVREAVGLIGPGTISRYEIEFVPGCFLAGRAHEIPRVVRFGAEAL